jgi:hypothetical protein
MTRPAISDILMPQGDASGKPTTDTTDTNSEKDDNK